MTKYYTEGIWGGLGPASGELSFLAILEVTPFSTLGDDIVGKSYNPCFSHTEVYDVQSGLDDDRLVGPSVLCKWSD